MSENNLQTIIRTSQLKAVRTAVGLSLFAFIGLVVGSILAQIILLLLDFEMFSSIGLILTLTISQVFAFAITGLIYLKKYQSIQFIKYNTTIQTKLIGIIILSTIVLVSLSFSIQTIANFANISSAENAILPFLEESQQNVLLFMILTVLIVGPLEEFFYRGIIQERLQQNFTPAIAIGITSLLFAITHLGGMIGTNEGRIVYILSLIGSSIILGILYEKTDNLIAPIMAHGLYNATIVAPFLF